MWGRGQRGNSVTYSALSGLSVTPPTAHNQIGPFWCCFPGGCVCVRSRTLWVSPTNSPVRLGVSPAGASTTTGVFNQRFCGFISPLGPWVVGLSRSPVVPPSLSACECGPACSASRHLVESPLCPAAVSALIPVWVSVSSLTPWLSDFHTV